MEERRPAHASTSNHTAAPLFEPLLDSDQAGQLLRLHPKSVQRMARRGELPAHRVGKYYRYRASELNAWIVLCSTGQKTPPPPSK
jgi:excisionase family DNA binding protein